MKCKKCGSSMAIGLTDVNTIWGNNEPVIARTHICPNKCLAYGE